MTNHLDIAIKASLAAGEKIMEIYQSADFEIENKADQSPLTKADKAAHECILSFLKKSPYPILSEEGTEIDFSVRKKWITFWMVDPLDGTKEFIKRNDEFTVNIALIHNQTPILGVVLAPVSGILYYANHKGAFKSSALSSMETIKNSALPLPISKESREYVVLTSRSHQNDATLKYIHSINTQNKPLKLIACGSSLKICQVAEGIAQCYPRLGPTMEWDTAAGHAIAKYAGKSVKTIADKTPLIYNKKDLHNPNFIVL